MCKVTKGNIMLHDVQWFYIQTSWFFKKKTTTLPLVSALLFG